MSIIRPELINDEIYHIVVRGVGDSLIFKDKNDYYRAIFSLYEFNTSQPVNIKEKRKMRREQLVEAVRFTKSDTSRKKIVENLAFCFMPNHIHLLTKQIKENGISAYMKKFGVGYANHFNKKYERRGHLFQGRFRAIHIKDEEQLKNVFVYIHTNPISLAEPNWKGKGISNPQTVINFLENYRWSSYPDYIGNQNFPSLTERKFILKILGDQKGCRDFVEGWTKHHADICDLNDIALE